jgi:hypothetical protein
MLPSMLDQFGVNGGDGGYFGSPSGGGQGSGNGDNAPPDYQATLDAVNKQKEEDQKALNKLGENVKTYNKNLTDKLTKTQKDAVAQLNKQQDAFKKHTVDVKTIKVPGIDPNVLFYGGLAFAGLAGYIVFSKK